MIALIGFGSEVVFSYVVEHFQERCNVLVLDLDSIIYDSDVRISYDGSDLRVSGAKTYSLPPGIPIYHRVFLRNESTPGAGANLRNFYNAFVAYSLNQGPGTLLVNSPLASSANASKAAQVQLLSTFGFRTPETILSIDSTSLKKFCDSHEGPINKGASGIRTIAGRVTHQDSELLTGTLRWPWLLQEYIPGFDVRLHCIGLRCVALRIETKFVDYRYAERNGYPMTVERIEMPPDIVTKCWKYMRSEKQEFAAFDFRVNDADWCLLEANPMPGFSFFDKFCDTEILDALWDLLSRGYSNLYRPDLRSASVPIERRPSVNVGSLRVD